MVRLVAFDLWQTLAYRDVPYSTIDRMLERTGLTIPKAEFVKLFERSLQTRRWVTPHDAYANLCTAAGLPPTAENVNLLKNIREEAEAHTRLYDYTIPLLLALHRAGIKIGLLSNSSTFAVEHIRRTTLLKYIDYPVFSFEVGAIKPDRAMFDELAKRSSIPLAEMVMVGDKEGDDVRPARKLGMRAIFFKLPAAQR